MATERARKYSSYSAGGTLLPSRKLLLQTGTLNFRPPVSRSKSVPRLNSIDEVDEQEELSTFEEVIYLFIKTNIATNEKKLFRMKNCSFHQIQIQQ